MNTRLLTHLLPPALLLAGCVIAPPPSPMAANDPSNPQAPEAASARFRPKLVATNRTYLSSSTGADAQKMGGMETGGMDHGSMKMGGDMEGMDHSKMKGMDHGAMGGMKMPMPGMAGKPRNPAEKETAMEEKKEPGAPSGEQLQSTHPATYTCRMHPEVTSMKPGKCPKCGMTLVSKATVEKQKATEQVEEKTKGQQP